MGRVIQRFRERREARRGGQSTPSGPVQSQQQYQTLAPKQTNIPVLYTPNKKGPNRPSPNTPSPETQLMNSGFNQAEAKALAARAKIAILARLRRKAFTRNEVQRLLGGGRGVKALRSATKKGGSYTSVVNLYRENTARQNRNQSINVKGAPNEKEAFSRLNKALAKLEGTSKKYAPKGNILDKLELTPRSRRNKQISQAAGAAYALVNYIKSTAQLGKGAVGVIKNPKQAKGFLKNIKNIPKSFKENVIKNIAIAKTNPNFFIGKITTEAGLEYVSFKGAGAGLKYTGKLGTKAVNAVDPLFKGAAQTGKTIKLAGKGGKTLNLKVVGSIPKESLSSQLKRAGTRVNAISSQADALVGLIRRKKLLRKPIPNEAKFSKSTKKLLKKFDKGTINRRELIKLDKLVRKSKAKGILERSFFADPNLRIRPSRLGLVKESGASLSDIFKGNITFRKASPQILLFEDQLVERFPKALKGIVNKIKRNKSLTSKESRKLLEFQNKKTGAFKPLGFVSRESEITLAPGEIVVRKKRLATVEINGRRVPIIKAEVQRATKGTQNLLKKFSRGELSKKQIRKLNNKLKKETGFSNPLSYGRKGKKYISPSRTFSQASRITSKLSRRTKKYSYKASQVRYTSTGKPYVPTPYGPRFIPPSGRSGGSVSVSSPSGARVSARSPIKTSSGKPPTEEPPTKPEKNKQKKRFSKAIPSYNVFAKVGKKFYKISKGPLARSDALSKGAYAVDNTTARTFKIVRAGKRRSVNTIPTNERGYFNKIGKKLRGFKIRRGQRFKVVPKYIEKRKYGIDTKGEKRGLSIARYVKNAYGKAKATRSRRAMSKSSMAYKIRIRNLIKARKVLARRRR